MWPDVTSVASLLGGKNSVRGSDGLGLGSCFSSSSSASSRILFLYGDVFGVVDVDVTPWAWAWPWAVRFGDDFDTAS